jgi:small subunit ribosomal protein S8e
MAVSHAHGLKKPTGGRKRKSRTKRKHELGSLPTNPSIAEKKAKKTQRGMGGNTKVKLKRIDVANVYDPASKKHQVVKIRTERENPANRNFPRRNILTKGAIIETEIGAARITSRPGQHGVVNAVLIGEAKPVAPKATKPAVEPDSVEEKAK